MFSRRTKEISREINLEDSKKAQKEAEWAYKNAMEKFYYSMLEVVFLRIKSHLNAEGLKKVLEMDEKRHKNKNLSVEFSQKTWEVLADSWVGAEALAMKKIADLYGLGISDLGISKIEKLSEEPNTPRCEPLN